jgi:hypothetical protein
VNCKTVIEYPLKTSVKGKEHKVTGRETYGTSHVHVPFNPAPELVKFNGCGVIAVALFL